MKPTPPSRSSYRRTYRSKGRRYLRSGGRRAIATYGSKRAIPMGRKNVIGSYYSRIPKKVYSQTFNVCLSAKTSLTDTYEAKFMNGGFDEKQPDLPPTSMGIDFRLKDALNANEFYGLMFNRYKINAIRMTFTPKGSTKLINELTNDSAPLAPATQQQYSFMYAFVDPNDAVKPVGNAVEMEDYFKRQKNVVKRRCDKQLSVLFKPSILNVVYQKPRTDGEDQGIDFGYTSTKSPWIEINELPSPSETVIPSLDFAHFGFKAMLTPSNPNNRWKYDITLEYYVSFNGIRR